MEIAAVGKSSSRRRDWLTAGALAVIAFGVFVPRIDCGFVNFDDPFYVQNVPIVTNGLSGEGFRWAFSTARLGNWHPLTWLSLQLDAEIWEDTGTLPSIPGHFIEEMC